MQLCIFVRIGCLAVLPLATLMMVYYIPLHSEMEPSNDTEIIRKKCGIMQRLCTVAMGREQ